MQIFVNTKYDFVRWRFHAVAFSVIFAIVGFGLFMKNGVNWGIDFAGGAHLILKFRDQVPMDRLRADLKDASIQSYGKPEDRAVLIRLPKLTTEADYAGQEVAKLNHDLNPETAAGKIDLNFQGYQRLADVLRQTDPDGKGTGRDDRYRRRAERKDLRRRLQRPQSGDSRSAGR